MYTYDIFISSKSEDYKLARNVYTFLVKLGYRVFLADAELRKKGNSEYGKVIDIALESSRHFILVASNSDFIVSPYVESEWRIFIEEIRAGRKKGNLLTILKDVDISTLPISLRRYQSFPYSDFYQIKDYLPDAIHDDQENIDGQENEQITSVLRQKPKRQVNIRWALGISILVILSFVIFYSEVLHVTDKPTERHEKLTKVTHEDLNNELEELSTKTEVPKDLYVRCPNCNNDVKVKRTANNCPSCKFDLTSGI